jgi:hypothetical protein
VAHYAGNQIGYTGPGLSLSKRSDEWLRQDGVKSEKAMHHQYYRLVDVNLLPLPYKRPESHPNKECARACTLSPDRTKLLLLSHNLSNVIINSTILNEAH